MEIQQDFSEEAKAEGTLHNVRLISGKEFSKMLADAGLSKIEALIKETQAKFVILDPLQGLCGQDIDMSRTNHIRRIMHSLSAVAERTQCVICLF